MTFSALILAGGKSSRMGRDKAWLPVGGETLLARQIGLARRVGASEVFISGRSDVDYSRFLCPVLKDKINNAGPLAGIERGLKSVSTGLLLVLAVDLPNISAECLLKIFERCQGTGAVPLVAGKPEPLVAFYPKAAKPLAQMLLRGKNRAVTFFAKRCVELGLVQFIEMAASETKQFTNWNSPADFTLEPPVAGDHALQKRCTRSLRHFEFQPPDQQQSAPVQLEPRYSSSPPSRF